MSLITRCDKCGEGTGPWLEYEWIVGREIARNPLNPTVQRVSFADIHPEVIRMCETCFAGEVKRRRRISAIATAVALLLCPAWVYFLTRLEDILPEPEGGRDILGVLVAVATIGLAVGALAVAGTLASALVRPRGASTVQGVLRPFLDARLQASGATHFWTRKQFDKVRSEQGL